MRVRLGNTARNTKNIRKSPLAPIPGVLVTPELEIVVPATPR